MTPKEKIKKLQVYIDRCKNLTETQKSNKHKLVFFQKEISRAESAISKLSS